MDKIVTKKAIFKTTSERVNVNEQHETLTFLKSISSLSLFLFAHLSLLSSRIKTKETNKYIKNPNYFLNPFGLKLKIKRSFVSIRS